LAFKVTEFGANAEPV